MNSRERILAAANRANTGAVPCEIRATQKVWEMLFEHFNVSTQAEVCDILDTDLRWVYPRYAGPAERSIAPGAPGGFNEWGNRMKLIKNEYESYYEYDSYPLKDAKTLREIVEYDWPSADWYNYSHIESDIKAHSKNGERAICYAGISINGWFMRSQEQFFFDMFDDPGLVRAICDRTVDHGLEIARRVYEAANGHLDVVVVSGDVGGQQRLMYRPDMWREQLLPNITRAVNGLSALGVKIMYHSCGSVHEIIPDIAAAGVDILDPLQITAGGMEPQSLADRFSDLICFHGAIDIVDLLPNSTPDRIYSETQRLISILNVKGGYIASPSHTLIADAPLENILAVYRAIADYNRRF